MAHTERVREMLRVPLTAAYLEQKTSEGWRAVAVEWERPAAGGDPVESVREEVPYGMRVAADCHYLEEHPAEVEVMMVMLEGIVRDLPLSRIASDLNARGHRTRAGTPWTQTAIFQMLPRLIDAGPRLFGKSAWAERRRLLKVV